MLLHERDVPQGSVYDDFLRLKRRLTRCRTKTTVSRAASLLLDFWEENRLLLTRDGVGKFFTGDFPHLLWKKGVEDTSLVFRCIKAYRDWKSGESLVSLQFLLDSVDNFGKRDRSSKRPPSTSCVEFFLRHVNRGRLKLGNQRITDLGEQFEKTAREKFENSSAVDWIFRSVDRILNSDPRGILKVLQHGGRFFGRKSRDDYSRLVLFTLYIAQFILYGVVENGWQYDLKFPALPAILPPSLESKRTVIKALLTSVRNPHMLSYVPWAFGIETCILDVGTVQRETLDIQKILPFYDALFPGLELGRLIPSSLKQQCRITVRDILNENWSLPDGVYQLPLPKQLCDYLNLLDD